MSGKEDKKLTVPRFSSFKPKSTSSADPPAPAGSGASADRRDDKKRPHGDRSQRDKSSRQDPDGGHRHRRDHKTGNGLREDSATKPSSNIPKPGSDTNPYFVIDRRGDPLITRYGSNDSKSVPHYRRGGRGRILGAAGVMSIHRDGNRQEFSLRLHGEGASVFRDRHLFASKFSRVQPRLVKVRREKDDGRPTETAPEDYLPLRPSKRRKHGQESPHSSEEEGPSYRSIEGKAKAHEFSDSDLNYSSDTTSTGDSEAEERDPLRQRSVNLSRRVKDRPDDIKAWVELVKHQDILMREGRSPDHVLSAGVAKSWADIKLSMYEEALPHAVLDSDRELLLIGRMREGAKVWPSKTAAKKWAEVAESHEHSFLLWKAQTDYEMGNLSTFAFSNMKTRHLERIRYLRHLAESGGNITSLHQLDSVYSQLIYVFLRATRLIYDAGFKETAVAAWQALIELNFHGPLADSAQQSLRDIFSGFWESEVARVGEDNAKGWADWIGTGGEADPPEPRTVVATVEDKTANDYQAWFLAERRLSVLSGSPARLMDEDSEDDPFRVVMFKDIEDMLFTLPTAVFLRLRHCITDAFLLFFKCLPAFGESEWITQALQDPFLAVGSIEGLATESGTTTEDVMAAEGTHDRMPDFEHGAKHFRPTPDLFFSSSKWFSYLGANLEKYKTIPERTELHFVLNTIRHLVTIAGYEELSEYYLAMEWLKKPEGVKAIAKRMLKQKFNAKVYNAYALAEFGRGSADIARKVVGAATTIPQTGQSSHLSGSLSLWKTGAMVEMQEGNFTAATALLCSSSEKDTAASSHGVSSTQVLKARQHFKDSCDSLLLVSNFEDAALAAECLCLLDYLTAVGSGESQSSHQGNITATMSALWTFSDAFQSRGVAGIPALEKLLQFAAWLLYFHATHGPFRRAYLRKQLISCISLFPRNTIFLDLFAWADASLRVKDQVRELLDEVVLTDANDCVTSRLFAIRHEMRAGNAHTSRAAFERALESDACRSHAPLWVEYIRFCSGRSELREKAVESFYRAINYCPWSKAVAMEAFQSLGPLLDDQAAEAIISTISTKGLRVHVDLEKFLEKRKRGRRKVR